MTTNDAIVAYPLETDTNDVSGNDNHLTNDGATYTESGGKSSEGYYLFDGSNDDMYGDSNIGITGSASRTLSFWAYTKSNTTDQIFVSTGKEENIGKLFCIRTKESPNYLFFWGFSADWATEQQMAQDTWVHHIITYDGTKVRWYINNSELDSGSDESLATVDSPVTIGSGLNGSRRLNGSVQMVLMYDRVITSDERAVLYNSGDFFNPYASSGLNLQVNIGDSWKAVSAGKINIGDSWKEVASIQQNIGDSWKTV